MEFYKNLQSFSDFDQIHNEEYFTAVPDDWVVLITDIKGSTKAVKEGRFKDVNMLGASAIAVIANIIEQYNTISVFGGDGATILVPMAIFEKVRPQLVGLIRLSKEKFNLEMRIGAVKVKDLKQLGFLVYVGKYQISTTTALSQLIGSGISKAESMIKEGHEKSILLNSADLYEWPNLAGLSCRLDKFKSRNGSVMSVIVKPKTDADSLWIRRHLLSDLKEVLQNNFHSSNPISKDALHWRLIPETMLSEIKFRSTNIFQAMAVIAKAVFANILLKFNISVAAFVPSKYKGEVPMQSDFKKFDDNLRMVIDCSEDQQSKINQLLKDAFESGHIFYGTHISDAAVVSCLTVSASQGNHVHYVDGAGCGYTMAAEMLKSQMKNSI